MSVYSSSDNYRETRDYTLKVNKDKLIAFLEAEQQIHKGEHEAAKVKYRKDLIKDLKKQAKDLEDGTIDEPKGCYLKPPDDGSSGYGQTIGSIKNARSHDDIYLMIRSQKILINLE
jgi:hypothetical protein